MSVPHLVCRVNTSLSRLPLIQFLNRSVTLTSQSSFHSPAHNYNSSNHLQEYSTTRNFSASAAMAKIKVSCFLSEYAARIAIFYSKAFPLGFWMDGRRSKFFFFFWKSCIHYLKLRFEWQMIMGKVDFEFTDISGIICFWWDDEDSKYSS